MLFNSIDFLIFFPIVLAVCFLLPEKFRSLWLLIASYFFYMYWDARYILLLLCVTALTYGCGLAMEWCMNQHWKSRKRKKRKKLCLTVTVVACLGVLAWFKYTNFLLENLESFFAILNVELNIPKLNILLPVGISFFTFQALGYCIDVYRGNLPAERNFVRYALFVAFFPLLLAGPIERTKNFFRQLQQPARFQVEEARDGVQLMLWGFFLKVVLADRIAILVDTVYGNWQEYGGVLLVIASLLFTVQLYCDFCGYSTIALGAAKCMGYHLIDNFQAPFFSKSISELWRRWHVSLNAWFRDYLYIPLGGNRMGSLRKYLNIMIVFLVSGLWHGADWTFVVWGALNGGYQILGRGMQPIRDKAVEILHLNRESYSHKALQVIGTFLLFAFAMIFFRADDMEQACGMIGQMISRFDLHVLFDGALYTCGLDEKNFGLMLFGIAVLLIVDFCKYRGIRVRTVLGQQEWWFRWIVIAGGIVFILVTGIWGSAYEAANFVYFQF